MQEFWWVILFTALLGAGLGAAYGLARNPTYTAESRLSVGRVDVSTQSINGYVQAALTLSDSYSRAIDARSVVNEVAQRTGVPQSTVLDRVSAAPIPQSPIVRVFGTGSSGIGVGQARERFEQGPCHYVQNLNKFNPQSKELLQRYNQASKKYSEALAERASQGATPQTQARVDSTRSRGRRPETFTAIAKPARRLRTRCRSSPSPRRRQRLHSALQRAIFAALLGGLLIGAAWPCFSRIAAR